MQEMKILPVETVVTEDFKQKTATHPDVAVWLSKVGYSTRPGYTTCLSHFLKCVGLADPGALLDLKTLEDTKKRLFPAERLCETWMSQARSSGMSNAMIKRTMDAVRSFFKANRIPLIEVKCSYKPKSKGDLRDEELRRFRECFSWYGKILFDFLLSVPIRDGQFQKCPNCGIEFFPRWSNIQTYPEIQPYSPFAIRPQKGHENEKYSEGLLQVCFLTETAATDLSWYRDFKERRLKRKLRSDEYIFTHQRSHHGPADLAPITNNTVIWFFQDVSQRAGKSLSPHDLRAYVNTVLATRGIDKQLRDIYLGHSVSYEMGYVMPLILKWQETFKEAHVMEHLDIMKGAMSSVMQEKLLLVEQQQLEIERLRRQIEATTLTVEELATFRELSDVFKRMNLQSLRSKQIKSGKSG